MTDTQQAAEREKIAKIVLDWCYAQATDCSLDADGLTDKLLTALSTPSGEPEDACPSSGGCPYCEQFGCPRGGEPEAADKALDEERAREALRRKYPRGEFKAHQLHESVVIEAARLAREGWVPGNRSSQPPRPAPPEDVRALLAEARRLSGRSYWQWGPREIKDCLNRLAAALERQAETQP